MNGRLGGALFLPVRRLVGPLHRRRDALTADEQDAQHALPPLPEPWNQDSRWYRAGFPPREHNELRPLIDGQVYFADLYATLQSARRRVTIAGWCLTPLMALTRSEDRPKSTLGAILDDVSRHAEVYVLLWSGAPARFEPTTRLMQETRTSLLKIAPRVTCELDCRASFSHDHHQKAVTSDRRLAYLGGMDLRTYQCDRWDTSHHELRS